MLMVIYPFLLPFDSPGRFGPYICDMIHSISDSIIHAFWVWRFMKERTLHGYMNLSSRLSIRVPSEVLVWCYID